MKKRTMIARALCASMVMSMLGGFAVQADEGEKVVINFYEHSDSDVIAEDLVEAYNASQDKVEVKLSLIFNDDYDDKVKVMLAWIIRWILPGISTQTSANR